MNICIIDNYDSFTYNLAHLVRELGPDVHVVRNDQFELPQLRIYDKLILSPGPGIPSEAGLLLDVIRNYATLKPILGICLGHQAIGEAFGARLTNLTSVYHGVATSIHITQPEDYLLSGLPETLEVGRYHSWVIDAHTLPPCLEVTATSQEGLVMAIRHTTLDVRGLQFHPESVLTPQGKDIIANWIRH